MSRPRWSLPRKKRASPPAQLGGEQPRGLLGVALDGDVDVGRQPPQQQVADRAADEVAGWRVRQRGGDPPHPGDRADALGQLALGQHGPILAAPAVPGTR